VADLDGERVAEQRREALQQGAAGLALFGHWHIPCPARRGGEREADQPVVARVEPGGLGVERPDRCLVQRAQQLAELRLGLRADVGVRHVGQRLEGVLCG